MQHDGAVRQKRDGGEQRGGGRHRRGRAGGDHRPVGCREPCRFRLDQPVAALCRLDGAALGEDGAAALLDNALRAAAADLPGVVDGGTMVVIQGPRFSTRAESQWFASQGFTLVNMTGYPEAVLARELEMCYAAIALVTDLDAGIEAGTGVRAVDVFAEFERNLVPFKKLVHEAIDQVSTERTCTHCLPHDGVELPIDLP